MSVDALSEQVHRTQAHLPDNPDHSPSFPQGDFSVQPCLWCLDVQYVGTWQGIFEEEHHVNLRKEI